MSLITKVSAWIAIALWGSQAGLVAFWLFIDDVQVFYNEDTQPVTPTIKRGQPLLMHTVFCARADANPGTAIRWIYNDQGQQYLLEPQAIVAGRGCYNYPRVWTLPPQLPPGKYHWQFRAEYRINPIRSKIGTSRPVPFEIVP